MSPRRRTAERARAASGFTLLECTVALLLFSLLVVGLSQLTVAHDRLVSSLDGWLMGDPVYYLDQPDDDLERVLGVPAKLSEAVPSLPPPPPPPDLYSVAVQSVTGTLEPVSASALVVMSEL